MNDERKLSHAQNFLRDLKLVSTLIDKTDIGSQDLVLEIGPGTGIITKELAKRAGKVVAIEFDSFLAKQLREELKDRQNIDIVEADFIKWSLPQEPYKVFSNIPFNLTADIVTKLLDSRNKLLTAYLIMQDVAAERFTGRPKETQFSILLKPVYEVKTIARIDRQAFYPKPNVDAVLVMFKKRGIPLIDFKHLQLFRDFVVYGYNQWKPNVIEAFSKIFTNNQRMIVEKNANIRGLKPSELSIEQWIKIFESFVKYVSDEKKSQVVGSENKLRTQQKRLKKQYRTRIIYSKFRKIHGSRS